MSKAKLKTKLKFKAKTKIGDRKATEDIETTAMGEIPKKSDSHVNVHELRDRKKGWEWLCCKCQTTNKITFEGEKAVCRSCKHSNASCYECQDYRVGK